ncbi:MAG: stage V sporulation protein AE [Clostridia bacterium]|nr:stage V sporulation protein AE [Clostridia bacterium]
MEFVRAFITGGIICVLAQLLIDYTRLTPARIVVLFVSLGVLLTALGVYPKIVDFGGAGATVPISGFGYSLARGVQQAVKEKGFTGVFTGGITAASGGISAAIVIGYIFALLGKSKEK